MLFAKLSRVFPAFMVLAVAACRSVAAEPAFDPPALYLQWQRDPTSTMTIHWHTEKPAPTTLEFRADGTNAWHKTSGSSVPMPDDSSGRTIHTVELTGLSADATYWFRFDNGAREYKFRTMPQTLSSPVRFVSAGDMYHTREMMDEMNKLGAKYDPAFIIMGGDLAYTNDRTNQLEKVSRWYDLFDSWKHLAVAPDGRLIPLLVVIGNHEVKGFWHQTEAQAVGFYSLFSMPGKQGYNVLDFGDYMSLLLLDSGHTRPVAGAQADWLSVTLSKRKKVPHVFPVYHVPAYPSARPFEGGENGDISEAIRKHWSPLFDRHGLKIAFENHEHTFKRTHPIRGNKVDPNGVVYLGDGAWGVRVRNPHPVDSTWYLAKAAAVRHFYLVTLFPDARHILAINNEGAVFDELYQRVSR